MKKIDETYLILAFVWLIGGMVFGIWLGASAHFQFAESHAHMALVGFVLSAAFGFTYKLYPSMRASRLATAQLWIYQLGAVLLVAGKITVDAGGGESLVKAGSVVILLGVLLMLYVFVTRKDRIAAPGAAAAI